MLNKLLTSFNELLVTFLKNQNTLALGDTFVTFSMILHYINLYVSENQLDTFPEVHEHKSLYFFVRSMNKFSPAVAVYHDQ